MAKAMLDEWKDLKRCPMCAEWRKITKKNLCEECTRAMYEEDDIKKGAD
jgi:hypothetical protein